MEKVLSASEVTPSQQMEDNLTLVYHPHGGDQVGDVIIKGQLNVHSQEADLYMGLRNGKKVVLKLYRASTTTLNGDQLLKLAHPNLAPILLVGTVQDRHYEVVRYFPLGGLDKVLAGKPMDPKSVHILVEQLSNALSYLHHNNILHRDIKPPNILVDSINPLVTALSDFGCSSKNNGTMLTSTRGTLSYSAPEAASGMFSPASDWWSLGMVILEVLTGKHPFEGLEASHVYYKAASGAVTIPSSLSKEWQVLLRGLLHKDYRQRWQGAQVKEWLINPSGVLLETQNEVVSTPRTTVTTSTYRGSSISLVELLAVVGVILVLAVLIIPRLSGAVDAANRASQVRSAQVIESSLQAYLATGGVLPKNPTLDNVLAVLEKNGPVGDPALNISGPMLVSEPPRTIDGKNLTMHMENDNPVFSYETPSANR